MKLATRSRIAVAAAVLATGALLGPAAPAGATYPICEPDHCDTLIEYYSDATYTVRVGEYGSEVCGYVEWGQVTQYSKGFRRYC
jgi:hypothetical protein